MNIPELPAESESKKVKPPTELTLYAKACGATFLENLPHDQIANLQEKRHPAWLRVLVCIGLHQFQKHHRRRFMKQDKDKHWHWTGVKPHATCCNDCKGRAGKPVQPKQIAHHLGMDEGNVRRTLESLESENRIVWERDKQIAMAGDFVLPVAGPSPDLPLDQTREKVCADLWAGPIVNQIMQLDQNTIDQLILAEKSRVEKFNAVQADLDAANRRIWNEKQDSMLRAYGVKSIREEHKPKDPLRLAELTARKARVELLIPSLRKYAQTFEAKVCADHKNGFAQSSDAAPDPMFAGVPGASTEVLKKRGTARSSDVVDNRASRATEISSSSAFRDLRTGSADNFESTTTTTPKHYRTESDELAALMKEKVGQPPELGLIWTIKDRVETRGGTLRAYIDDITPRLRRLRNTPGFGFFYKQAREWGGTASAPIEPVTVEAEVAAKRCNCGGRTGRLPGGSCCTCALGRDLERFDQRKRKEGGHAQKSEAASAGD